MTAPDNQHIVMAQKLLGCFTQQGQDAFRLALCMSVSRVVFETGDPPQKHDMNVGEAADILSAFFTEFPGGVEEMRAAMADAAAARASRGSLDDLRDMLRVEVDRLIANTQTAPEGKAGRDRDMLQRLEWNGWQYDRGGEGKPACPWCGKFKDDGHEDGCELAAVLAASQEPQR